VRAHSPKVAMCFKYEVFVKINACVLTDVSEKWVKFQRRPTRSVECAFFLALFLTSFLNSLEICTLSPDLSFVDHDCNYAGMLLSSIRSYIFAFTYL
jgi:hypothetical protein